jgi:NDP-sugar pyrophosphorylase family protein
MSRIDVQILIPMTGEGSRFKNKGYEKLKPFIEVAGAPMVGWVTKLFRGYESNIKYVCRQEHLKSLDYVRETLEEVNPLGNIISVEQWVKKGPVFDILQIQDEVDDDKPVVVCYCDFYMHWDFNFFINLAVERGCDGAIPCYTGFHPHLLVEKNVYASCKIDSNNNLIEIKEKFSWTTDKQKSMHSPGVYFFKSGKIMKKYFALLVASLETINNEYYCSLPYNKMVQDGLVVWCPDNVNKFCQWGTPYDLEEFNFWFESFRSKERIIR